MHIITIITIIIIIIVSLHERRTRTRAVTLGTRACESSLLMAHAVCIHTLHAHINCMHPLQPVCGVYVEYSFQSVTEQSLCAI